MCWSVGGGGSGSGACPLAPRLALTATRAAPDLAELQDLLPGIINQLGPDNLANLKKLAETYQGGGARVLTRLIERPKTPRPSLGPREGPGLATPRSGISLPISAFPS